MTKKNDSKNKKQKGITITSSPEYEQKKKEIKIDERVVKNIAKEISKYY